MKSARAQVPPEMIATIRERTDLPALVASYGVELRRDGGALKGCCPFHGERTPSFTIYPNHFYCFGCQAKGDAIAFVMQAERITFRGALERLARDLGIDLGGIELGAAKSTRSPKPSPARAAPPPTAPAPSKTEERPYPDAAELAAFWRGLRPVPFDAQVSAWLERFRIDPGRVARERLALALPEGAPCPWWAAKRYEEDGPRVPWSASGHRLIVPLCDRDGRMRSVLARDVTGAHRDVKSLSAVGNRRGLFMMDSAARAVLTPSLPDAADPFPTPPWFTDAPERRVLVVEGEKKFLMCATAASEADPHAPATLGIVAGSHDVVELIPDGWTVAIATDPDKAGAQYATKIVRLLEQRVRAGRLALELMCDAHELVALFTGVVVQLREEALGRVG